MLHRHPYASNPNAPHEHFVLLLSMHHHPFIVFIVKNHLPRKCPCSVLRPSFPGSLPYLCPATHPRASIRLPPRSDLLLPPPPHSYMYKGVYPISWTSLFKCPTFAPSGLVYFSLSCPGPLFRGTCSEISFPLVPSALLPGLTLSCLPLFV